MEAVAVSLKEPCTNQQVFALTRHAIIVVLEKAMMFMYKPAITQEIKHHIRFAITEHNFRYGGFFMKKAFTILLSILTVFSFTSCTDKGNEHDHSRDKNDNLLAGETVNKENPEDYDLTIASCGYNKVELIIPIFEEMYDLTVRVIEYDSEKEIYALDTKLMAEDDDIDIFYTASLPIYKYVRNGYYTDLNEFDTLKEKIQSNNYAKAACRYNDKYFGLSVDPHITNEQRHILWKYLADHVNLIESEYTDQDGEQFFKLLKYAFSHPDDLNGDGLYDPEKYYYIIDSYLIISPFSQNKETAALFLETVFDYFNGELSYKDSNGNEYFCRYQYPDVEDISDAYFSWNITTGVAESVIEPLMDAYDAVSTTDGSDEALRKLAKDAAREVRQRLEG